ncbi:MAG TPA: TAXI family TRAP transporter solute-binding subunit [Bosea sp. (in: a-proteobacteria)]|jgi:TRAP transporter TAXI family solute receptor|uniref:TAXI family TRAP transporter solute-binding subunit n=1 Tax=Bosea sp. (in: a-proteobacteria) TaxID=1871050 RepID=UPI002E0FE2B1|nr:TAXI family TRAP transporter solute-binding subunit [Bosea sp. (in: a-proteobacteria)]
MVRRSAVVVAAYALVALLAVAAAIASGWYALKDEQPVTLAVAVGGKGGNVDQLMNELREVVATQSKTIRLTIVHTDGSATNARMAAEGKVALASVQADIMTAPSVKTVAVVGQEHFQLIARRSSEIRSLRDLAGKRLALPPEGTSGNQNFFALAQHHDLPLAQIRITAAPVNDNFAALERGEVDAIAFVRALRDPATIESMRRLQQKGDGLFFVPVEQASAIRLVKPYVSESTISQGTYQGFPPVPERDTPTLAIGINLVAGAAAPDAAVEELTRILFEEQLRLAFRTPLAAGIARPSQSGPSLAVHPGAKAFYDGAKPFLLMRYRDEITFLISILTIAYSGLMVLRLQIRNRRKVRVSAYNDKLIEIASRAQEASDVATLQRCRADLNLLIQRVMKDFSEERISDQGFHVFSLSWEAVRASIAEAIGEVRAASSNGPRAAA